jgi:L-iditol 2-dehydrogenase
VIEASGSPAAVPEGLEMLRDAGRYVVVGQYTDAGDATLNPHRHVNRRHATILGCWGFEYTHLHRAVLLLARHRQRFRWRELISREYPLAEASRALADMERLAVVKGVLRPSDYS